MDRDQKKDCYPCMEEEEEEEEENCGGPLPSGRLRSFVVLENETIFSHHQPPPPPSDRMSASGPWSRSIIAHALERILALII